MWDTLAAELQLAEAVPGILAATAGVFLVWSAPFVWSCVSTGRVPGRIRNLAFWIVGGWHTIAAASLVVVFGIHHAVLAFLVGGVFAHLAGLYLADGDVDRAYERFDAVAEESEPSDAPVPQPNLVHLDAA